MALNAAHIFVRLHMLHTLNISPVTTAQQIIDFAKAKGVLKHLVINCHGFVDHSTGATTLAIGTHFDSSNVGLFSQLKGHVGVIWIDGCLAAGSKSGSDDCKERAQNAECFVVAPAFLMAGPSGDLPMGRMDMNRRFMPVVFDNLGGRIAWDYFLKMGKTLHFTVS
jgi:hypothetical protein